MYWRREYVLVAALLLYGALGSPMPREITLAILLPGVLILLYVGPGASILPAWTCTSSSQIEKQFLVVAFLYLLWAPLLVAVVASNNATDIVRDVIPHGFLFLPLLLSPALARAPRRFRVWLATSLAVAGTIMSVRFIDAALPSVDEIGTGHFGFDGFQNLAADPSALFAGIFFPALGLDIYQRNAGFRGTTLLRRLLILAFAFVACIVVLGAYSARLSRGPVAFIILFVGLYLLLRLATQSAITRLTMLICASAGLVAFFYFLGDKIMGVVDLLMQKQEAVGTNGKDLEFYAVIQQVSRDIPHLIFGYGWGATLDNPFRWGAYFTFTHNIVSYYLLKSGVLGAALITAYCFYFIPRYTLSPWKSSPFLAVAAVPALYYPFLLQPTYKVLSVGVIAALLRAEYLAVNRERILHPVVRMHPYSVA